MRDGSIEQVGPPLDVFERPATSFVAQFVGSPAMNLWPAEIAAEGRRLRLTAPAFAVDLEPDVGMAGLPARVAVGARPHEIDLTLPGSGDVQARVTIVESLGASAIVHVQLAGPSPDLVRVLVNDGASIRIGDAVGLRFRSDRLHLFGQDGRRIELAAAATDADA